MLLRPIKPLSRPQARLITMFLRTPLALALAGPRPTTTMKALAALPVPLPDEALTRTLDELTAAKHQLKRWEQEADSVNESAFREKTAAQARVPSIDSGRALRLRVEAASLLDDVGHNVRTCYPYLITFAGTRPKPGSVPVTPRPPTPRFWTPPRNCCATSPGSSLLSPTRGSPPGSGDGDPGQARRRAQRPGFR
ncbi:hypothetical protein GCM10010433_26970 [Streptomyces pulveraceus]